MSKGSGGELIIEFDDLDTDPVATPRVTPATPTEIERDALILDLAGRLIEELKIRNPSPETLKRAIKCRLPQVFSVVNDIILEEEPLSPQEEHAVS